MLIINVCLLAGMRVVVMPGGLQGRIEGSFGKSGKCKVGSKIFCIQLFARLLEAAKLCYCSLLVWAVPCPS
jgi:hypothetical protein